MALFGPKGLRADVTEGIDLEQGVMLTGDKITIGSDPADTLCLGASDVVAGHITLQKRLDGKGWDYFTSDRGQTLVDKGNPRTGPVRPGMWLRLGAETQIEISRTALPATQSDDSDEKTTVPLPVALGVMGTMILGFALFAASLGTPDKATDGLFTTAWFSGAADIAPHLDTCLSHSPTPPQFVAANALDAPFWTYMLAPEKTAPNAMAAHQTLSQSIKDIIAEAHLLRGENEPLAASTTLRRLEYVLPVGLSDCPILSAARVDLARLEMSANR